MDTQATKLEHAENDLKRLMDDVSRAMHKAQEAVARMAGEMPTVPDRLAETAAPKEAVSDWFTERQPPRAAPPAPPGS